MTFLAWLAFLTLLVTATCALLWMHDRWLDAVQDHHNEQRRRQLALIERMNRGKS